MRNDNKILSILFISLIIFLTSCSITRHLDEGQALLVKNKIAVESIDSIADNRSLTGDLYDLAIQEPNDKMLGIFRFRLRVHNMTRDTTKRFNRWLNKKGGEPPVIFDEELAAKSAENMKDYLISKGYFDAVVSYTARLKNKKSYINYSIKKNYLTRVNSVQYDLDDEQVKKIVTGNLAESPLKPGKPYDIEDLLDERKRITLVMLNQGYYKFNKQFIAIEVDTLNRQRKVDLYIKVDPPDDSQKHVQYHINELYIYPDYNRMDTNSSAKPDTITYNEYHLIGYDIRFNPKSIISAIFFKKGDLYSKDRHQMTATRLTELDVFRFVNIQFREKQGNNGKRLLDVIIRLLPAKKQSLNFNWDVTTSSDYFLGSELGVSYKNKNLFKYSDLFSANVNAGVEAVPDTTVTGLTLNTIDFNASASFFFPKFIVPFKLGPVNKSYNPKTHFTANYNYFRRLNLYTLNSTSLSYGFDWKQNKKVRHLLDPIVINFVKLADTTSLFNETLEKNPLLKKSFANQLIIGSNYTYVYTGQSKSRKRHFWFFKGNLDIAGNLLYAGYSLFDKTETGESFKLLNRPFFQYIKPDAEVRYYLNTGKKSSMVFRLFGGIGIPWGNSDVLPYIKQYTIGGSNSIRAFRIRQLGPGAYKPDDDGSTTGSFTDRTGDIKLETNIEYRFDLTSMFKGALFIDAGNIWLLGDSTRPEGVFKASEFYKQIAIGTGIGLRLDFSLFVMRVDLGIPLRDPSYDAHSGWRFDQFFGPAFKPFEKEWRKENLRLNLAIGYPF